MTYEYQTSGDGLCVYATKRAAIRNASKAGALLVKTARGRIVWRNPKGGEERGELRYRDGTPMENVFRILF
jgi:hypothetical protein